MSTINNINSFPNSSSPVDASLLPPSAAVIDALVTQSIMRSEKPFTKEIIYSCLPLSAIDWKLVCFSAIFSKMKIRPGDQELESLAGGCEKRQGPQIALESVKNTFPLHERCCVHIVTGMWAAPTKGWMRTGATIVSYWLLWVNWEFLTASPYINGSLTVLEHKRILACSLVQVCFICIILLQ